MKKAIKAGLIVSFVFICLLVIRRLNKSFAIYRDVLNTKIYLTIAEPGDFTINFYDGETLWDTYARTTNQAIGALPTNPTKSGYNFVGWYTETTGGTKISPDDEVDDNADYYARWVKIVCKKETDVNNLHVETCASTGSCHTKLNYGAGADLVYGQISQQTAPELADAYNCDVNADDIFRSDKERFYFIRKGNTNNEDTAVLLSYSSIDENGLIESDGTRLGYHLADIPNALPVPSGDQTVATERIWSNPGLIQFNGRSARLLNLDDFHVVVGGSGDSFPHNVPTPPETILLFENTRFQGSDKGRAGIWMDGGTRVHTNTFELTTNTQENAVRPVIEIPYTAIEGYVEKPSYNINFNTMGGSSIHSTARYEGETIGQLPTPIKPGFNFLGWYTDSSFTTEVDSSMVINSNVTIFANWEEIADDFEYVFYIPGTCVFGSDSVITGSDCISTINPTNQEIDYNGDTKGYIDTGIALFNQDNYHRDFEVGFTINEFYYADNPNQATMFNAKLEYNENGAKFPGLTFRRQGGDKTNLQISYTNNGTNRTIDALRIPEHLTSNDYPINVVLRREGQTYSYSYNGGPMVNILTGTEPDDIFNMTSWFGAASGSADRSTVTTDRFMRKFVGTLSNMYISFKEDPAPEMNVTFDGDNPTSIEFSSKTVKQGRAVGSLPVVTKSGYKFVGWFTQDGQQINENTVITDDVVFYAHYKELFLVTFVGHDGTVSINPNVLEVADGESIGVENMPTASMDGYAFAGWYTHETDGVRVYGNEPITADVTYHARYTEGYTVTFDDDEADTIDFTTKLVRSGEPVGSLPTATKTGFTFGGWYVDTYFEEPVDPLNTIITSDITFHVMWIPEDAVCEARGSFATTLKGCYDKINVTTKSRLLILKDIELTEKLIIAETKNIVFDLNDKQIVNNSGTIFENRGIIEIMDSGTNGTLNGGIVNGSTQVPCVVNKSSGTVTISSGTITSNKTNVIDNSGQLYITGGTITIGNVEQGVVNNNAGATLHMTGGYIYAPSGAKKQGIYNKGTAYISGTAYIKTGTSNRAVVQNDASGAALYISGGTIEGTNPSCDRGTVQNIANASVTITGGTIISVSTKNNIGAVQNAGTLTIGDKNDVYDATSPVLQGIKYGVYSSTNYSVYDGIFRGVTAAVNDEGKITSKEDNAKSVNVNETIDLENYHVLYYTLNSSVTPTFTINFNANGGTVSPDHITVDVDDTITSSDIPTPTRGNDVFAGWYTDIGLNTPATYPIQPSVSGSTMYYAKWTIASSDQMISFNPTNSAMTTYYSNINTWKNSSSNFPTWSSSNKSPNWALDSVENTVMMQNFNSNNCACADNQCTSSGTVQCDKPLGYDTNTNAKVNVYLYDEVNETKGALVTYAKADNGVIHNLIPGQAYKWELDSDPTVYGYVKFTGERRILDTGDVRNTRDLGGLPVDSDGNGTIDGYLAYGRLFRGIRLPSSSSVDELEDLGINSELDLREANSDTNKISRYQRIEAQNYFVNPFTTANHTPTTAETNYYNMTRAAVKYAMQEIVAGRNLYFHCRIGTDRTGTVAWVLEGLLGVPEEDRVRDYEISFFYGLVRIHRFHNEKPGSSVGTGKERFVYMHNFMPTNQDIYNWYMFGSTNTAEDNQLINDFRNAMIESN